MKQHGTNGATAITPGAAGPRTLIQGEQQGRLTELTSSGNRAEVRVVQDGLTRASGVTLVGNTVLVLVELTKAVVAPYPPRPPH